MPFRKWFIPKNVNGKSSNQQSSTTRVAPKRQVRRQKNQDITIDSDDDVKIVYLASDPPHEIVLSVVNSIAQNNAEVSQMNVS